MLPSVSSSKRVVRLEKGLIMLVTILTFGNNKLGAFLGKMCVAVLGEIAAQISSSTGAQ